MFLLSTVLLLGMNSCDNPSKSRVYTEEGSKLLLRYSKFDEAEETLTKAIKYDKHNFEAYYYRGCAKVNGQKYKEAIADFVTRPDTRSCCTSCRGWGRSIRSRSFLPVPARRAIPCPCRTRMKCT